MSDNIAPSSSNDTSLETAFNFLLDFVKVAALGAAAETDPDIQGGLDNLKLTHEGPLKDHFPAGFDNELMIDLAQSLVDYNVNSGDGIKSVLAAAQGSKYLFFLPTHNHYTRTNKNGFRDPISQECEK